MLHCKYGCGFSTSFSNVLHQHHKRKDGLCNISIAQQRVVGQAALPVAAPAQQQPVLADSPSASQAGGGDPLDGGGGDDAATAAQAAEAAASQGAPSTQPYAAADNAPGAPAILSQSARLYAGAGRDHPTPPYAVVQQLFSLLGNSPAEPAKPLLLVR